MKDIAPGLFIAAGSCIGVSEPGAWLILQPKAKYARPLLVLRVRDGQVRLFSLNNIPHLTDPSLRTHR